MLEEHSEEFFWAAEDGRVGQALLAADLGQPVALMGGGGL